MDAGKILMGTAMVMLMIGLLVHPVGATSTGDIQPVGEKTISGGSGQAPVESGIPGTPYLARYAPQLTRTNV